jgi:NADP-dependent alcohol dehydrogenase
VWRDQFNNKKSRLAQYGRRVWGLEGNDDEVADTVIAETERFFHSMGVSTTLTSYGLDAEEVAETISKKFAEKQKGLLGERKEIDSLRIKRILQSRV